MTCAYAVVVRAQAQPRGYYRFRAATWAGGTRDEGPTKPRSALRAAAARLFKSTGRSERFEIFVAGVFARVRGGLGIGREFPPGRNHGQSTPSEFCGALKAPRAFLSRVHLRQKPTRGLLKCLRLCGVALAFHKQEQTTGVVHGVGNITHAAGYFVQAKLGG